MPVDSRTIVGFAGSLAVLGMLAVSYGAIRRRLLDSRRAETSLGLLFGLVAVLLMNSPLEPFDGLLVDLRTVPIVLAGAFLGLRGVLACVILAAAARLHIGGVGALAGILAMVISGGAGAVWSVATAHRGRGAGALVGLGALACTNFVAVVMLPPALALWSILHAAPVLAILYLAAIPPMAHLMRRERDRIAEEGRLREATRPDESVVPPHTTLSSAIVHPGTVGSLQGPVDCLGLRLRHHGLIGRLRGADIVRSAFDALGARLADIVPSGGVVGWAGPDLLLMSVPRLEEAERETLIRVVRSVVDGQVRAAPGVGPIRLGVDVRIRRYRVLPPLPDIVADMRSTERTAPDHDAARGFARCDPVQSVRPSPPDRRAMEGHDLFATFDTLRAARIDAS